jgi:hypothetical protein
MIMRRIGSVLLAALCLSGCATLNTSRAASAGEGIEYALPASEFVLEVTEADGYIAATLAGPVVRQDNNARYRTKLVSSGVATNDFTIEVNERGLLTSLTGTSDGQFTEIAKKAARTVAFQSGGEANGKLIYAASFRLSEIGAVQEKANQVLVSHVNSICATKTDKGKDSPTCLRLRKSMKRSSGPFIVLTAETLPTVAQQSVERSPPDKASVLYYRPLISVRITLELGDGQLKSKIFAIPDESRANWVSIPGGVFAKQEYNLTFTDGVLTKYHRVARNEVVGAVSLPVDVAKELIAAPFEALTARKEGLDKQTEYLKSVAALETASASAEKACADSRAVCQDLPIQSMRLSTAAAAPPPAPAERGAPSGSPTPAPTGASDGSGTDDDEGI